MLLPLRKNYRKFKYLIKINWFKTLYFNFKVFPYEIAKKLPVYFFGKVSFQDLSGTVLINGPIKSGMIGFGQRFELAKCEKGVAEVSISGRLVFNGPMHFGKDVFLYVGSTAYCEFGYMSALGSDVRLVCTERISIGDWSGIGYESQVIDTNSHPMKNSSTGEYYPMTGPIEIGSHNTFSNRVSIMANTKTPDYCIIASNSVCNKDYTGLGKKILIGGVPAKLLKENYIRDWEGEYELLKHWKKVPEGM